MSAELPPYRLITNPISDSPLTSHKLRSKILRGVKEVAQKSTPFLFMGLFVYGSILAFAREDVDCGAVSGQLRTELPTPLEPHGPNPLNATFNWDEFGGSTNLNVPPLGGLSFDNTHPTPVNFAGNITSIDTDEFKDIGSQPQATIDSFVDDTKACIQRGSRDLRNNTGIALGESLVIGYALTGPLRKKLNGESWKESYRKSLYPLIAVGLMYGGLGAVTYATADFDFHDPTYSGSLARAPEAVENIQRIFEGERESTEQLAEGVTYLSRLYTTLGDIELQPENTINILVDADSHCYPNTTRLLQPVIDNPAFDIDFRVNLGDSKDRGSTFEAACLRQLNDLNIRTIAILGNHDGQDSIPVINQMNNVILLDGDIVEIEGLRILGFSDPHRHYTSGQSQDSNYDQLMADDARQISRFLEYDPSVDILLVHNPASAAQSFGLVDTILTGHTHRFSSTTRSQTIEITDGSIGAAGLRSNSGNQALHREAMIVSVDRDTHNVVRVTRLDFGPIGSIEAGFTSCDVNEENELVCP